MNKLILLISLGLAGCGLDPLSVAKRAGAYSDSKYGSDCEQSYNEVAFLENHTALAVNTTMAFQNYTDYGAPQSTVTVQIPAGGTWTKVLATYTQTNYGSTNGNGDKVDAVCTSTPQISYADLSTLDGSSTVRRCKVKQGVAYLVSPSSPCPDYTSE